MFEWVCLCVFACIFIGMKLDARRIRKKCEIESFKLHTKCNTIEKLKLAFESVCVRVDWGRKRKRQPKRSSNYIVPLKCFFIHILTECESECETFASFPHRLLPERERAHKFVPINVLSLVPGCIWVFWVVIQSGIPRASVDLLHRYQFAIIFFFNSIYTMNGRHFNNAPTT